MSNLSSLSFGLAYGVSEIPKEVLGLFTDLALNTDKRIEFTEEIVSNGLQGRIDFNKPFNIDAYEATIRKNQNLCKESKRKKVRYIDFSSGDDYEDISKNGGIREDDLHKSSDSVRAMRDAFEEFIDDESLQYAVNSIKALSEELLIEEEVDLIEALKSAKRGTPSAVTVVKNLCSKYTVVADLIYEILDSGRDLEEVFA